MRVLLIVVTIFQLTKVADSVLCWQCDSLNYHTCAVQTCQGNRCQTRTAMNGVVSHMFAVSMGTDGCTYKFGAKVCVCSGDKCNKEGINDSGQNAGFKCAVSLYGFLLTIFFGIKLRNY